MTTRSAERLRTPRRVHRVAARRGRGGALLACALALVGCRAHTYPAGIRSSADFLRANDPSGAPIDELTRSVRAGCFAADGKVDAEATRQRALTARAAIVEALDVAGRAADRQAVDGWVTAIDAVRTTLDADVAPSIARTGAPPPGCATFAELVADLHALATRTADEVVQWQTAADAAADSWDAAVVQVFLDRWPDPPLDGPARARLREIQRAQDVLDQAAEAVGAAHEDLTEPCDALQHAVVSSPLPDPSSQVSDAWARCEAHAVAIADLQRWEPASLGADALDAVDALTALTAAGLSASVEARAHDELLRRFGHVHGCTRAPDERVRLTADALWFLGFPAAGGADEVAGWAEAGTELTVHGTCQEDAPTGQREREAALVSAGHRVGFLFAGPRPSPAEVRQHLLDGVLGDVAPCTLTSFGDQPWTGMGHRTIAALSGSTLTITLDLFDGDDAKLQAGITNLLLAEMGSSRRASTTDIRDADLLELAPCVAAQVQRRLAEPEPTDIPDHVALAGSPPGVSLFADAMAPTTLVSMMTEVITAPRTVVVALNLFAPTEVIDAYGVRTDGRPRRLRSAKLTISGTRLLRNDWASIAELVRDAGPTVDAAAARGALRRFVDGWSTW